MNVRLCFHDRCFDGAASAAVFLRFYRERISASPDFHLTGMTHLAKHPFENDSVFDGDENVIVDFKYSSSPKLTWWFDHHQSAFLSPADAESFRNDRSGRKFYDPTYKSCTKLIADIAREQFGFNSAPLAELIHWGDIIDGAQYPTPESAVTLAEPATQLCLVIEAAPESLSARLIPLLAEHSLSEIVRAPLVQHYLGPLLERHERSIGLMRSRAEARHGVVFFDVSDLQLEGYNKFIPYFLYPDAYYSVGVSASPARSKVSVGTNPWHEPPVQKNLAALCEQYGGGGHAKVAAISLPPGELEKARRVAQFIAVELRR